jgi:flagellar assembly protein FliH
VALARVIKNGSKGGSARPIVFNFDDLTEQATRYLTDIKRQGDSLLERAHACANDIREEARQAGYDEGRRQAADHVEQEIERRAREVAEAHLLPSLTKAVEQLADSRAAWLRSWETGSVRLALAIAERLIRRKIAANPEVSRELVADALELFAGATRITLRMNPEDLQTLGNRLDDLFNAPGGAAPIQVVADAEIASGDCVVQTAEGTVDARLEARLRRIEEELLG